LLQNRNFFFKIANFFRKLGKNFAEALQKVDEEMHLMNATMINRVKARLVEEKFEF